MGNIPLPVLAFALSGAFGVLGVLVGLWFGVRTITRDEERWRIASDLMETVRKEMSILKIDWGTTLEHLEQLADATEKRRRRAAAAESASRNREESENQPLVPLTPSQERMEIRKRIRSLGGR